MHHGQAGRGPGRRPGETRRIARCEQGGLTTPTPAENHDLAGCFACGTDNPNGIRLRFRFEDGRAVAETTCRPGWVSWNGLIHGGILTTMMDEAMGWAVAPDGFTGLTARLSTRLLLPLVPGQPLVVRAWVERWRRRVARTAAELVTPGGTPVATAEALMFVGHELPQARLLD